MTHYPFTNLSELSFEFRTENNVVYHAYFIAYGSLFANYPEFSGAVYSFNLDIAVPNPDNELMDEKIALTVVAIFKNFFNLKNNIATIFATMPTSATWQENGNLISGSGNITMAL